MKKNKSIQDMIIDGVLTRRQAISHIYMVEPGKHKYLLNYKTLYA